MQRDALQNEKEEEHDEQEDGRAKIVSNLILILHFCIVFPLNLARILQSLRLIVKSVQFAYWISTITNNKKNKWFVHSQNNTDTERKKCTAYIQPIQVIQTQIESIIFIRYIRNRQDI